MKNSKRMGQKEIRHLGTVSAMKAEASERKTSSSHRCYSSVIKYDEGYVKALARKGRQWLAARGDVVDAVGGPNRTQNLEMLAHAYWIEL